MTSSRKNISSGGLWETKVGYSRAVRVGDIIVVAGTTATDSQGNVIGINDAYTQTKVILEKIGESLKRAGASMKDVVRTRMFVTDIGRWDEIGRAHGEVFGNIRPASTLIEVKGLITKDTLVEIEVEAIISD